MVPDVAAPDIVQLVGNPSIGPDRYREVGKSSNLFTWLQLWSITRHSLFWSGQHVKLSSTQCRSSQQVFRNRVYSIAPGVRGYRATADFSGEVLMDRDGKSIVIPMSPAVPR